VNPAPGGTALRVLVVDDEPLARERIRMLLQADTDVAAILEGRNGEEAAVMIQEHAPDLVFLDVQMPGLDGFDALRQVRADRMPLVIFVTAYEQYALRAFEVHALDYLLKPFDRERFQAALGRAKERLQAPSATDFHRQLRGLLDQFRDESRYPDRLAVKKDGRILSLKTVDVDWIEAEGNYVRLHLGKQSYLHREKIATIEARLDPRCFRRIHRSTIVNVGRIKEFVPWFRKDYRVILQDGTELTLSRNYKDRVQELLGGCE
jgi:two-component system, LytTR family, response regulator